MRNTENGKQAAKNRGKKTECWRQRGFTLIELMIVLVIFSVVMAGLYAAYSVQMRAGVKEYKFAQSEMEFQIAKSVIERDIAMAGSGIADVYCSMTTTVARTTCTSGVQCADGSNTVCMPVHLLGSVTGTAPQLTLMGTALGRDTRASQAWSYTTATSPTTTNDYRSWLDPRERLQPGDQVIYIDPNSKSLLYGTGNIWNFPYPATNAGTRPPMGDTGMVVFGLTGGVTPNVPYYVVQYTLNPGGLPSSCAQGSTNLMRSESKNDPPNAAGQPLINCVLDYETALGLDVNNDGVIDCWDLNGAACAAGYRNDALRAQLKQVKMWILVQDGARDLMYTFPSSMNPVMVGDWNLKPCVYSAPTCTPSAGSVGKQVTISGDQLNYRWKVLTSDISPRNIR